MDRDTIIRLARQAGWQYADGDTGYDPLWRFAALIHDHLTYSSIHTCHPGCTKPACVAMREAVLAEREACAKVCEEFCDDPYAALTAERIRRRHQE